MCHPYHIKVAAEHAGQVSEPQAFATFGASTSSESATWGCVMCPPSNKSGAQWIGPCTLKSYWNKSIWISTTGISTTGFLFLRQARLSQHYGGNLFETSQDYQGSSLQSAEGHWSCRLLLQVFWWSHRKREMGRGFVLANPSQTACLFGGMLVCRRCLGKSEQSSETLTAKDHSNRIHTIETHNMFSQAPEQPSQTANAAIVQS